MHEQGRTTIGPATNQTHVASAGPGSKHFTFDLKPEKLVYCSVKVNSRFLSKVTHEQRRTTRRPATNQQQRPYVASASPDSQHFTFCFVSKVSLDF